MRETSGCGEVRREGGREGWIFILEESQSLEDNQTRIHKR